MISRGRSYQPRPKAEADYPYQDLPSPWLLPISHTQKPNLIMLLVLLYIERKKKRKKKRKSCFCFLTDINGKQDKACELDMITPSNHKNHNFLDYDWFKKRLFFTNSLPELLWDSLLLDSLLSDISISQSHGFKVVIRCVRARALAFVFLELNYQYEGRWP